MIGIEEERWDEARRAVIHRWRTALDRIAAHDERGTLEIANTMDDFCREAMRERTLATGDPASTELRCRYCREYFETGGCLGLVGALNHWVLNGNWQMAGRMVDERIHDLELPDRG